MITKRTNNHSAASLVSMIFFTVAFVGGWVANFVKVIDGFGDPLTGMALIRTIGIFLFPIGAILGYV